MTYVQLLSLRRIGKSANQSSKWLGIWACAVPTDVSLVAFGRNVLQLTYPLAVTAYVPDYEQIGEKTVELLLAVLREDTVAERQIQIRGRLVERESVRRIGPSLIERI